MKKFLGLFMLLAVILTAVFVLNMGVMYVVFGINVLNSEASMQEGPDIVQPADEVLRAAASDTKVADKSTLWEGDYYMTADEIAYLSHLGLEDKLSAMAILSKLGLKEMDRFYEMSYDGVTVTEFAELNAAVESKLTVSDIEALKEILNKSKKLYAENDR